MTPKRFLFQKKHTFVCEDSVCHTFLVDEMLTVICLNKA